MKKITTLFLVLLLSTTSFAQNLTTEDLFKKYLVSEDPSIGNTIIKDKGQPYGLYCQALRSDNSAEQIKFLTDFIELSPGLGLAEAYRFRGLLHNLAEDYDKSEADLNKSIELNDKQPYAFYFRGSVHTAKERPDQAIADFTSAIALKSDFHLAYLLRGQAYGTKNEYEKAISDFNKTISLDPVNVEAFTTRGITYLQMEQFKKALNDMDQAINLDGNLKKVLKPFIKMAKDGKKDN